MYVRVLFMSNEHSLVKGQETYYHHSWIELTDMILILATQYFKSEPYANKRNKK